MTCPFSSSSSHQSNRDHRRPHRDLSPLYDVSARIQQSSPAGSRPRHCASAQIAHRDTLFSTFHFSVTGVVRSSAHPQQSFKQSLSRFLLMCSERYSASDHRRSRCFLLSVRELEAQYGEIDAMALRPHGTRDVLHSLLPPPRAPLHRRRSGHFCGSSEEVAAHFPLHRRISTHILGLWGSSLAPSAFAGQTGVFLSSQRYLRLSQRVFVGLLRGWENRNRARRCETDCCTAR